MSEELSIDDLRSYAGAQLAGLDPGTVDQILSTVLHSITTSGNARKAGIPTDVIARLKSLAFIEAQERAVDPDERKPDSEITVTDRQIEEILVGDGKHMRHILLALLKKLHLEDYEDLLMHMLEHGLHKTSLGGYQTSFLSILQSASCAQQCFAGDKRAEVYATAAGVAGSGMMLKPQEVVAFIKAKADAGDPAYAELVERRNAAPLAAALFDQRNPAPTNARDISQYNQNRDTFISNFTTRFNSQLPAIEARQRTVPEAASTPASGILRSLELEPLPKAKIKREPDVIPEPAPALTS